METSTIITIVYFCANITLLILLAIYVKKTGEYESIKSKTFLKDIWSQKKIFGAVLVHFYDTATDLGVVYYWFKLMENEQKYGYDYKSIDMTVFFWCGIAFLLLYRLMTLVMVTMLFCKDGPKDGHYWYDIILVLLDLYIFKAVYLSMKKAQKAMQKNIELRNKKKKQKETEQQTELQIKSTCDKPAVTVTSSDTFEEIEIEIGVIQGVLLMFESITESTPQIVLQSVFIIRSANEPQIADNNTILILLSIIASLISISNKYGWKDREEVAKKAQKLKPQKQFPNCVQYWYVIRVIWRLCNIMSTFSVYVLLWCVFGGGWLFVWFCIILIMWMIVYRCTVDASYDCSESTGFAFITMAGLLLMDNKDIRHILKYIETVIALLLIAIFGKLKFEFVNDANNDRILIFFIMGCASALIEPILYCVMRKNDVINKDKYMDTDIDENH